MKAKLVLVIWCFCVVVSVATASAQAPVNQIELIKRAVSRRACFQVYWYDWNLRRGISLPLHIKIEADKFRIWIEGIEFYRGDRIDDYFSGTINSGSVLIKVSEGFNVDLNPSQLQETRARFDGKDVITDTLTIPKDCTPRYDPPTAQKDRMLWAVIDSINWQLEDSVRRGIRDYPKTVTLVIANFNVDYPDTFVVVESPRQIWAVNLREQPTHYDDVKKYEYLYPSQDINIKADRRELVEKIRKHGIKRTIKIER